jgi:hypothetical protein
MTRISPTWLDHDNSARIKGGAAQNQTVPDGEQGRDLAKSLGFDPRRDDSCLANVAAKEQEVMRRKTLREGQ